MFILLSMNELPPCPKCQSAYVYEDRSILICPECSHEFNIEEDHSNEDLTVLDANGIKLQDGDTISIAKDLKVKGSSTSLKVGTKVKKIRLVDGDHNIDCKIPGFGSMKLKSEFVKKVN